MIYNCSKNIAIIGYGGFAKELSYNLKKGSYKYFIHQKYLPEQKIEELDCIENINFDKYAILLGIGDIKIRKSIIENFPKNVEYATYIDQYAKLLDKSSIKIGVGTVICAGSIITSNVNISDFCQINLLNTISHNVNLNNFTTTAPGVNVNGNVTIGNECYIGSNTSIRNKISITNNVVIGMGSSVINNIEEPGVYVGIPAKKIK